MLRALRAAGWRIETGGTPIPASLRARHPSIPGAFEAFATAVRACVSPTETEWFLTATDYAGEGHAAFAWNEWELLSLDAAGDDEQGREAIRRFWDRHLPILLSVRDGYAYLAIDLESPGGAVVAGREPEFEDVVVVARSFEELTTRVAAEGGANLLW